MFQITGSTEEVTEDSDVNSIEIPCYSRGCCHELDDVEFQPTLKEVSDVRWPSQRSLLDEGGRYESRRNSMRFYHRETMYTVDCEVLENVHSHLAHQHKQQYQQQDVQEQLLAVHGDNMLLNSNVGDLSRADSSSSHQQDDDGATAAFQPIDSDAVTNRRQSASSSSSGNSDSYGIVALRADGEFVTADGEVKSVGDEESSVDDDPYSQVMRDAAVR